MRLDRELHAQKRAGGRSPVPDAEQPPPQRQRDDIPPADLDGLRARMLYELLERGKPGQLVNQDKDARQYLGEYPEKTLGEKRYRIV